MCKRRNVYVPEDYRRCRRKTECSRVLLNWKYLRLHIVEMYVEHQDELWKGKQIEIIFWWYFQDKKSARLSLFDITTSVVNV